MKICILMLLFLFICANASDISIETDNVINDFIKNHKKTEFVNHRSGFKKADKNTNSTVVADPTGFLENSDDKPGLTYSNAAAWKKSSDKEYKVLFDAPTKEFGDNLVSKLKSNGMSTFRYSEEDKEFYIERSDLKYNDEGLYSIDGNKLDSNELLKIADKIVKKAEVFEGRVEYSNAEYGYLNGKLSDVNVRYRRIFRNGIVLNNLSYLYVKLDVTGKVLSFKGRWPKFISYENESESIDMESSFGVTMNYYENTFDESVFETYGQKLKPVKAKIKGMAFGWKALESETDPSLVVISPHYSYMAEIAFSDGESLPHYFNCPRLKKYMP